MKLWWLNLICFVVTVAAVFSGKEKRRGLIFRYVGGLVGAGFLGWGLGCVMGVGMSTGSSICALLFQVCWLVGMLKKLKS